MFKNRVSVWDIISIFWHGAGFVGHILEGAALAVLLTNYSQQFENQDSGQRNKAIPLMGSLTLSNLWDLGTRDFNITDISKLLNLTGYFTVRGKQNKTNKQKA